MQSLRHLLSFTSAFLILVGSAQADFIILKSGERVEGKIEDENDKSVRIEVQISPSISDDRVIQKADIVKVSKTAPDEEAYQSVMNVQTGANSLAPAQYARVIAYLNAFVAKYPTSSHATEIKQTIKGFEADKKRVDAGEVKMNGEWLDKLQTRIQRVQVEGVFAFENMKGLAASGDFVGALDYFVQIEKVYVGARTYPDAIELAKQVLVELRPLVETAIVNEKISKDALEKGWKDAGPKDRDEMMRNYQREQGQAEAAQKAAEQSGGWPPFVKDSEKCLKALQTKIASEYQRLVGLPVSNFRDSVELSDQAARQAASGENTAAKVAVKEALTLWPANEAAKRIQDELAQVKIAPATPAPAPVPAAAAPTPRATPSRTLRPQ
jgi:hypothetical protein